jgi:hypothetical protein
LKTRRVFICGNAQLESTFKSVGLLDAIEPLSGRNTVDLLPRGTHLPGRTRPLTTVNRQCFFAVPTYSYELFFGKQCQLDCHRNGIVDAPTR